MPAGFAGSRSLDERRRRRLAQESVDQVSAPGPRPSSETETSVTAPTNAVRRSTSDESFIPQSPWRILFLSSLLFAAWIGMLWLGVTSWTVTVGLYDVLSLEAGRTVHLFSTVCLLMAAQLSFFILWHRARSRKDFGGRYRIWAWAGLFWGLTCFASATEIYLPLASMTYDRWPIECWRAETLFWIGPFAICYLAIHRLLAMEMRTSKAARHLWALSFWIGVVSLSLQLGLEVFIVEGRRQFASLACLTAWHALISISLLTHARYVAHVTNEASEKVITVRKKALRWGQQRWEELRLFLQAEESGVTDGVASPDGEDNKTPPKSKQPSKPAPPTKPDATAKPKPVEPTPPVQKKPEPVKPEPAKSAESSTRVLGQNVRMDIPQANNAPHIPEANNSSDDDADGEDDSSSLSKKERRRLRKLEKQRSR